MLWPLESQAAGTVVEPDKESPFCQMPPSLSIDTVTLSAPTTVHDTVTSGFGPTKVASGAAHAAGFDTEKLVMICGVVAGVVARVVAGVVAFGAVVVAAALVDVESPTTVVDVEVVVGPVSVDELVLELQPATTALTKTAERSLRRVVIDALYAERAQL